MFCAKCQAESPGSDHCVLCGMPPDAPAAVVAAAEASEEGSPKEAIPTANVVAGAAAAPESAAQSTPLEPERNAPLAAAQRASEQEQQEPPVEKPPAAAEEPRANSIAQPSPEPAERQPKRPPLSAALESPPDAAAADPTAQSSGPNMSAKTKNSEMRDYNRIEGKGNIIAEQLQLVVINPPETKSGRDKGASSQERTLLDFVADLPEPRLSDPTSAAFGEHELRDYANALEADRILLLSCSDVSLSRAAVGALIDSIGITGKERQRFLNLGAIPASFTPDVHQLFEGASNPNADDVVLVVEALAERARPFVDSLVNDSVFGRDFIRESLGTHRLLVVCLVDVQRFVTRVQDLPFEHWAISSIEYLLRPYFPDRYAELAAKITSQRNGGRWSRAETDFDRQLSALLKSDGLLAAIEMGGPISATDHTAPLADGDQSPVHLAVLYTATFYPDLAPMEFARVLTTLLGDEQTTIAEKVPQKASDGTMKVEEMHREKPLVKIWEERSDAILRECRLITIRESNRSVVFADGGRRDQLRVRFEEDYGVYVETRFVRAWKKGLIFDVSDRIAADVIRLSIDMAATNPDQFGRDWLLENLEQLCNGKSDSVAALRRFAELFRSMLAESRLDTLVPAVLERLLQARRHQHALELVKNLRFAPRFDDLYWLKQLIDRSDETVRATTYIYLYNEVRRRGISVFRELARWLPLPDRVPLTYSPSNAAALRLMLQYCLETTERFGSDQYGLRPTRFPLLVTDAASAPDNFALLVQFLLHPGIKAVVNDAWPDADVLALLVSRWVFILFGYGPMAEAATDDPFPPEAALRVLVEQLIEGTRERELRPLRQSMLESWEGMSDVFALAPGLLGAEGRSRRQEFAAKRALVKKLITEFRRSQRDLSPVGRQQAIA
jgi:hypothetical protein